MKGNDKYYTYTKGPSINITYVKEIKGAIRVPLQPYGHSGFMSQSFSQETLTDLTDVTQLMKMMKMMTMKMKAASI